MERVKEEQHTRPSIVDTYSDEEIVIHRRTTDTATPYVPVIRVVGAVNVRELLGRDDEDDGPTTHAHP
ncbi:MAG: hypothetical protein LC748_02690 [Thermomicrobia bacterium]|nr:hypothetical protein [Thermomicrobia bacterium]